MILVRLGSLNALEQTRPSRFWNHWLGGPIPSADTVGRVFALTDCDTIRAGIHEVYTPLKRNKALDPPQTQQSYRAPSNATKLSSLPGTAWYRWCWTAMSPASATGVAARAASSGPFTRRVETVFSTAIAMSPLN